MKNHSKFEELMLEIGINENSPNFGLIYKTFMAAQPKWINVNARLPEINENFSGPNNSESAEVLVFSIFNKCTGTDKAIYDFIDQQWINTIDGDYIEGVTHWTELPEPPE